ncbi:MAG TPA: MarR family transcriptional regulator [Gaiellaceae bacterium]|nr:MarR family transcriptional regulator [Gaiellaceae bacterium]
METTAFARLLRALAAMRRELEARLVAAHGLTVSDFEALLALAQSDEGRMRRVDLAERLTLSPSGITRLLEGLEQAALVRKQQCADDQRVTWAVVTDAGRRTLEEAATVHDETMRELVSARLEREELRTLVDLLGRLPGGDVDGAPCRAT